MPSYRDLDAWQLAHRLTLAIYALTEGFPRHERFGLIAQLRRAAYSIPTNIAEGSGRFSKKDYRRFVAMAAASASEVEYLLLLVPPTSATARRRKHDTSSSMLSE